MLLTGIRISNFLSFREFRWPSLDPHVNLIVGPNGAGKTNVIRALQAAVDALHYTRGYAWQDSANADAGADQFEIELDLVLDGDRERKLLGAFVAASLANLSDAQGIPGVENVSYNGIERLSAYLLRIMTQLDLGWLLKGRLVVRHHGDNRWSYQYKSLDGCPNFSLDLSTSRFLTRRHNSAPYLAGISAWRAIQSEQQWEALHECLSSGQRDPDPPEVRQLLSWEEGQEPQGQVYLKIATSTGPTLAARREFERLAGVPLDSQRDYDSRFLFHTLLGSALVFSDNIRKSPSYEFTQTDLGRLPPDLSSGEQLALHLFNKKNGTRDDVNQYHTIQDTFHELTDLAFDVGIRERRRTEAKPSDAAPQQILFISVIDGAQHIPLQFSGAGITEALFLSAIVARQHVVVLLDEPASNLHALFQRRLMNIIESDSHNQYLVVTHAQTLVRPHLLPKVSRFSLQDRVTTRTALGPDQLSKGRWAKLGKELRDSSDVAGLLFCQGVILCEGGTELGALPVWYEKKSKTRLEQQGIVFHAVGGAGNFQTYVHFLEVFKVPWVIICDGDAVQNPDKASKSLMALHLRKAGIKGVPDVRRLDFAERKAALERFGVYTTADCPSGNFEKTEGITELFEKAKIAEGDSKPRQGRHVAEKYDCPRVVSDLLQNAIERLAPKSPHGDDEVTT